MLTCGHDDTDWYSICSAHQLYEESCPRCNVGRCIRCVPEWVPPDKPFFDRKTGQKVDAFPNLW